MSRNGHPPVAIRSSVQSTLCNGGVRAHDLRAPAWTAGSERESDGRRSDGRPDDVPSDWERERGDPRGPVVAARRAGADPGAGHGTGVCRPRSGGLREHLLRRRGEEHAQQLACLLLRLVRRGRLRQHRQAPARPLGAGRERQVVRLLGPEPAGAGGPCRRALRGAALPPGRHGLRPRGRASRRPHSGAHPDQRGDGPEQYHRQPADPDLAPGRMDGRRGSGARQPSSAAALRGGRGAWLQHQDAASIPGRPGLRSGLPARRAAAAPPPAAPSLPGRRGAVGGLALLGSDRRSDPYQSAPLRQRQRQQLGAEPGARL